MKIGIAVVFGVTRDSASKLARAQVKLSGLSSILVISFKTREAEKVPDFPGYASKSRSQQPLSNE
jgi:hypothetical protein